jgi:hypothetical protein
VAAGSDRLSAGVTFLLVAQPRSRSQLPHPARTSAQGHSLSPVWTPHATARRTAAPETNLQRTATHSITLRRSETGDFEMKSAALAQVSKKCSRPSGERSASVTPRTDWLSAATPSLPPQGLVGAATGSVNGNTWTWMVEDKFAGKAIKGRTTTTVKSASQWTSKYEMLDANGRYVTITEGTATKVAP